MNTAAKAIVTAASGSISLCAGIWLRFKAGSLGAFCFPAGTSREGERLHALIAVASAFLWLGVALLVLSAAAWLFFVPALSPDDPLATEPIA